MYSVVQALISAVFSIVFQAISQGFFPRFHVDHTSDHVGLLSLKCDIASGHWACCVKLTRAAYYASAQCHVQRLHCLQCQVQ